MRRDLSQYPLVCLVTSPECHGRVVQPGPQQSVVRWSNGNEVVVNNTWIKSLNNDEKLAPAPAPEPATVDKPKKGKQRTNWSEAEALAKKGVIPPPPDFTAPTHARFRPLLAEVVKAANAKDSAALADIHIKTNSSSPKAVDRYRNLCLLALKSGAKK